jgi:hypothetical protein
MRLKAALETPAYRDVARRTQPRTVSAAFCVAAFAPAPAERACAPAEDARARRKRETSSVAPHSSHPAAKAVTRLPHRGHLVRSFIVQRTLRRGAQAGLNRG